jgi:hypothetical protein
MKRIFKFKKYFHMSQCYSGERCGPWASCCCCFFFLEIFFSRTSRPKSIKLGTNHSWVKGLQVCSIKGQGPFQRGDNHENIKNGLGSFKNLLKNYRVNFNQTYHKSFWVEGIQVC